MKNPFKRDGIGHVEFSKKLRESGIVSAGHYNNHDNNSREKPQKSQTEYQKYLEKYGNVADTWNYWFGSPEKRLDNRRRKVEGLVAGDPNLYVLWKAYRLVATDDKQPVGALVFAAVANYKMFHKTRNSKYLRRAVDYIDKAYNKAEGAEREQGVAPHLSAIYSDFDGFQAQELSRELAEQRECARNMVLNRKPSKGTVLAASKLVAKDAEQPTGAHVLAAVANYKMFNKTGNPAYIDHAMSYIEGAMRLASSDEERDNNIRPHFDTIARDYRTVHGDEVAGPRTL